MGNCLKSNISPSNKDVRNSLPIGTVFKLPSPLPTWPAGGEFGSGVIDLGGLQVRQLSSFKKVWAAYAGGPGNLGATFFEPSSIPDGFSMLGSYAQPNNQPLFGWVLVGKTDAADQSGDILKQPTDYNLVWANNSTQDPAYFWLPTSPDGYKPVGHVITTSPDKPSLDKIRCVRADFTDEPETDNWIWAGAAESSGNGLNVYGLRPKSRGTNAQPLSVGTFIIQNTTTGDGKSDLSLSCLKNTNSSLSTSPNLRQVEALFQTYSPYIYFHPKEIYLPSSVNWYFSNGVLLYKNGQESSPLLSTLMARTSLREVRTMARTGSTPVDEQAKEKVKKGDLQSAEAYLHVKPILGATFTDIQVWLFYPFNGHAVLKLGVIDEVPLGKIGEHVGDWEHVTLRISNFDGVLYKVYFAEHSGGKWVDSCLLEFQTGNKFVGYSSLNGHATYHQAGLFLQGASRHWDKKRHCQE
ncbi:UNVERIFIED_CONTAM: hypothetical protein Sangu_3096800 [Sesamum angustifolium]|uniref:Vacuolar protein sorting-associated protein 62 n=1 Tax=Sesamum angustifolium TaxID=2727405 RepID=A0AAW2K804_9LAMI